MEDLQIIKNNVKILLTQFPKLRSPYQRKQFHVMYWKNYNGLGELTANILMEEYPKWTSGETISRAIRKVFEENPDLKPTPEFEQKRFDLAENHRKNFRKTNN